METEDAVLKRKLALDVHRYEGGCIESCSSLVRCSVVAVPGRCMQLQRTALNKHLHRKGGR